MGNAERNIEQMDVADSAWSYRKSLNKLVSISPRGIKFKLSDFSKGPALFFRCQ